MARRTYLHIGAPKSGTTYLQQRLFANQSRLLAADVLIPGRVPFDHNRFSMSLRGEQEKPKKYRWQDTARTVRGFKGTAIISQEWLVATPVDRIRELVEALGGPDRVEVVLTARNLVSQVTAAWQEQIKVGTGQGIEEFTAALDHPEAKWNWGVLDAGPALAPWEEVLGAGNITVVSVPLNPTEGDTLWDRFARACSIPESVEVAEVPRANESITAEAAAWLRTVGPALLEQLTDAVPGWQTRYRLLRNLVAHDILAKIPGSRIAPPPGADRIDERARETAKRLSESGYRLIGSADDLIGYGRPSPTRDPSTVTQGELDDITAKVVAELAVLVGGRKHRSRAAGAAPKRRAVRRPLRRKQP